MHNVRHNRLRLVLVSASILNQGPIQAREVLYPPSVAQLKGVWIGWMDRLDTTGPMAAAEYHFARLELDVNGRGTFTYSYLPDSIVRAYSVRSTRTKDFTASFELTPADRSSKPMTLTGITYADPISMTLTLGGEAFGGGPGLNIHFRSQRALELRIKKLEDRARAMPVTTSKRGGA